jgi:hypothetical protein
MSKKEALSIIIVDKSGTLKCSTVKEYNENDLYKKCGFKKAEGFEMQTQWNVKMNGNKYIVSMYAKSDGKAGSENKYDFPPPVDTKLFFGSCALVAGRKMEDGNVMLVDLNETLWEQMYEKLFGGFEDLNAMVAQDEDEEDELENIPSSKKTKNGGYLKDGFVVDDDDVENNSNDTEVDDEESDNMDTETSDDILEDSVDINEVGSELSEESYV